MTGSFSFMQKERKRLLRFHPGSVQSDDVDEQNDDDGCDELDVIPEIASDSDSSIYFTFSENA